MYLPLDTLAGHACTLLHQAVEGATLEEIRLPE